MNTHALRLIDYEHWANEKVLKALSQVQNPPSRTIELFSHILAVSAIWLSRAKGEKESAKRFDLYNLAECEQLNTRMQTDWKSHIDSLLTIDEKYMTFMLLGQQSQMTVLDCINHVALHGSYHRGQIVALLKEQLHELPLTDYVLFATR